MKILCVEPGPAHSTIDVYNGITVALRDQGHLLGAFALHNRLLHADECLTMRWRRAGGYEDIKPTPSDVVFHASSEVVQHALYHKVDWVLYISTGLVHDAVYEMLRRAHVPQAVVLTESPYEDDRQIDVVERVDLVFTNERTSVEPLRKINPNTHYLMHAYDPEISRRLSCVRTRAHDVVFVGTMWQERIDLLAEMDWSGIDLGIYGSMDLFNLQKFPQNEEKRARLEPYLHIGHTDSATTTALYKAAKIGLNVHRTSMHLSLTGPHMHSGESMNPRCFQQAASGGALLVSDYRAEIPEVFGTDVPTFRGAEDLRRLIGYYLGHDDKRRDRMVRLRTAVEPHTYLRRTDQLTQHMERR